jgi:hypothetical protein
VDEQINWLPVDSPPLAAVGNWPGGRRYTPRCTGHETWVGTGERVFLSTGYDEDAGTSIWTAATSDLAPAPVNCGGRRLGHVSASHCGRFWIADEPHEEGVPIHVGAFGSEKFRRLVFSETEHDGTQLSHTHPYLTADNGWLVFNSTRSGRPQVYGARLPSGLLEALAEEGA